VFGNEFVDEDSLAVAVGRKLASESDLEIIECHQPDDVMEFYSGEDCYILDVAEGIDTVRVIHDIDDLEAPKLCSLHDFDLGFFLKLLKKMGTVDKVKIICLPMRADLDSVRQEVLDIISLT